MSDLDLNEIYHFAVKLAKDVRQSALPHSAPTLRVAELSRLVT